MKGCIKIKLRFKIALLVLFFVIMEIALAWIMNNNFLVKYYINSEKKFLMNTYYEMQKDLEDDKGDIKDVIDSLSFKKRTSVFIADISQENDTYVITQSTSMINPTSVEYVSFSNILEETIKHLDVKNISYNITIQKDKLLSAKFLLLQGMMDSDTLIIMRIPIDNIEKSAAIFNRFLLYSGLIILIIGAIVLFFISKRLTKPIEEMALVAENLTNQKFDAKVKTITNDELGTLGESINILAVKLEEMISDLKSANLELQNNLKYKIEIEEIRREFLTQISHELKTPIALIQGYAEGLTDDVLTDNEDRKYYSNVIVDEAKNMNKLVSKLMSLNQLELGNKEMHIVNFNINEVITNRIEAYRSQIWDKKIEIYFDDKEALYVWADEFMIEEVINNYLSNAINHTERKGNITIYSKCDGDIVRICIRNTGESIPAEDIHKIWTKLYKVDKARTRELGGIGLGLSIVAAIMNAHGKGYGVSNVKDGVEFYLDLNTN